MSSFDRVPVHPSRVGRRDATRIVALRHVGRVARRSPRSSRILSVLVGIFAVALVSLGLVAIAGVIAVSATIGVLSTGLPDPSALQTLTFDQPTVVYDRTGKVELGRFQRE